MALNVNTVLNEIIRDFQNAATISPELGTSSGVKKKGERVRKKKTARSDGHNESVELVEEIAIKENSTTHDAKPSKKAKHRKKKKAPEELLNFELNSRIEAILDQTSGSVIRKRGDKKRINVDLYSKLQPTYVATTPEQYRNRVERRDARPPSSTRKFLESPKNGRPLDVKGKSNSDSVRARNHKAKSCDNNLQSDLGVVSRKGKPKKKDDKDGKKVASFEQYYTPSQIEAGLSDGTLVKGTVRINPKFSADAYVSSADRNDSDYYISSLADRNRSLEGDEVVLKVYPESEWRDKRPMARVVQVSEQVHPRTAIGNLQISYSKGKSKNERKRYVSMTPRDKRLPRLNITEATLPPLFYKNATRYLNLLFQVRIVEWDIPQYAMADIVETIGEVGNLEAETKAILAENEIDTTKLYYTITNREIDPKELTYREDFRDECVFTIDPATAKDLDDALSCKRLDNGNFEIGVHIADVSYYFPVGCPLDDMVAQKATSTYLVDKVHHMLPLDLCLQCSLLPSCDRLTFSVIFELNGDAEVINKRFTRSVIKSCTQLSYEHAQRIIENETQLLSSQFPYIHTYSVEEIADSVRIMHGLAQKLRSKRVGNGALRIDQIKLSFTLDGAGMPVMYNVQVQKEANWMIEEFMLLANINVAERIYEDFPNLAFLRLHEAPLERLMEQLQKSLEAVGIHLAVESSGELSRSLIKYKTDDYLGFCRFIALNNLLAKPMTRAKYFCSFGVDRCDFSHYALAFPIYTHFTSPIRRYADIMVHRLLAASLGYTETPNWSVKRVKAIAAQCNKQKYSAKRAGEQSTELYLAHYVEQNQPFVTDAVVVGVTEKAFDVITVHTGTSVRVFLDSLDERTSIVTESYGPEERPLWKLTIAHPAINGVSEQIQIIEMFQVVQVTLTRKEKSNKLEARLVRPSRT